MPDAAPTLESVRDELYGLAPGDFVAARTRAEKAARKDGDRELAAQIKALGKPTVVAWLANQLVRTHRDEIEPLLELGAELREATRALSGEQLRALSRQQHQVVMALVRQARAIAEQAGQPVTDATASGLEETLRAALADETLAQELSGGALTTGLQHVGFGPVGGGPAPPPRPARQPADDRAGQLRLAEEAVSQARAEAERAFDAQRHARSAADDADAAARTAAETVTDLERQLAEARDRLEAAQQAASQAAQAHAGATRELERARETLQQAEAREGELRGS